MIKRLFYEKEKRLFKIARAALRRLDTCLYTDFSVRLHNYIGGFHRSDYIFSKKQFSFVHLPKTAGTSLSSILERDPKKRFVGTFMHRPVSLYCPPQHYSYITVMRDPVDRVWSYYQMALRKLEHKAGPYCHLAGKGLEFFLQHCWEVRNMACRFYTGDVYKEPTASQVDKAWANLECFHNIISFEKFNEDVECFLKSTECPQLVVPVQNRFKYNVPKESDREKIRAYNSMDVQLYDRWRKARG
jgi:hypothetical protein